MPDEAEVGGEVAREEILVRRREHRDAAAGRLHRQRAVARLHRHALCLQAIRRRPPQDAFGVVKGDLGVHVVARPSIRRRRHLEPGVVVVRHVRILRRQNRFLLHQTAAGVERVGDAAFEAAHARAVEDDLDAVTSGARGGTP